jgi:hypothetical protein
MNGMDTSMDTEDLNTAMIEENTDQSISQIHHLDETIHHVDDHLVTTSTAQPTSDDHQEAIAQLCAISGADPDIASDVLSVCRL